MTNFPFSKTLFWDVNINELDLSDNKNFIIERVLVRGGMKDMKKITALYSQSELINAIKKSRGLDEVTHNFCANYFNIPKTSMHAPSQYY
jgi:hypothetical protein